ncbi:MAG: molybdopterin-dependent oxidoreductase [Chromatiales bacterium]
MSSPIKTTCPYCGVGCGVDISVNQDGSIQVRGDQQHPANYGKLCSKGSALGQTISDENRLLQPRINSQPSDWPSAIQEVADRFRQVINEHGPDAVAFYVSGQLLTEDYYVANKLMKGFIGSGNIDTNSRLCMSSSVAGHKRAFGSDTVPGCYEDLEQADLIVLTGSNLAWCHPVLYQRIVLAKRNNANLKIVVIDPRRTASCDMADLHLPLRSGSDAILFNGLLHWLDSQGYRDQRFVNEHTQGIDECLHIAQWHAPSALAVAEHCRLDKADVEQFYRWFAGKERVVTVYSQGINQSSSGTDKVNAIINCHLLTGRIGRPGMGPFSVTGQPNAMGGREVGALANQLTAHMDFERADHVDLVKRFWNATNMASEPGFKAVDLFQAVEQGKVKALWIMATNPAVSLPDSNFVNKALAKCEFLVVSDVVENDTTRYADVLLPATTWGEREGTVTNSERCISRQRAFKQAPGEAKHDWWMICQVARQLGYDGFTYETQHDIFSEYARLSGFENHGDRDFDISALADISPEQYALMPPQQWPIRQNENSQQRLFGNGQFYTDSRRANFVPVTPRPPGMLTNTDYPLVLNSGRIRDQWHTMTRTGMAPRLTGHVPEPYAELHPDDGAACGIDDGALLRVTSRWGEIIVRARLSPTQQPGNVFVPMHWNDQFASAARVDCLVNPLMDPLSGQPEFKHTPVRINAYQPVWHGFVLARHEIQPQRATYWSKTRREAVWHYELAGEENIDDWAGCARELLSTASGNQQADWSEMLDLAEKRYHAARFVDGQLEAVVFIGPDHELPPRDWLVQLFSKEQITAQERSRILAATPGPGQQDVGRIVCSCFSVGENTLLKAIREDGLQTPEALGKKLQAGTNCGSCVPELRLLIAKTLASQQPV